MPVDVSKGVKKIYRKYCCHGVCTSNTNDREEGVRLIPFAKPCADYISTIIDSTKVHDTNKCPQCSKCLRWIHLCQYSTIVKPSADLCKRAGSTRLKELYDIGKQTYICSKHFVDGLGPTDIDPDPYPADSVAVRRKPARRQPLDRSQLPPPPKKTRNESEPMPRDPLELPDLKSELHDPEYYLWGQEPEHNIPIPEIASVASQPDPEPEDRAPLVDHGYIKPVTAASTQENITKPATLKTIAYSILDNGLYVKFDEESLSVSSVHGHLAEKTCVVDRALNVQLFVLGRPVPDSNRIWRTNPKVWTADFDYVCFLKEFFEKWFVCCPSMERNKLLDVKERMRETDQYTFDSVTETLRSLECSLLSPKKVCFYCHKMLNSLRDRKKPNSGRKIFRMTREEAQKELREFKTKYQMERKKNKRKTKKIEELTKKTSTNASNADNIDSLSTLFTDGDETDNSDIAKVFFAEQIKAAKSKSPNGYRWHSLMIKWCLNMISKSPETYAALRKVFILPSHLRLTDGQAVELGLSGEEVESSVEELASSGNEEDDT